MNTAQAAVVLGKTPWWVRRQCVSGELHASRFGGTWLISPAAIEAFLDAHSNAPRPAVSRQRRRRTA